MPHFIQNKEYSIQINYTLILADRFGFGSLNEETVSVVRKSLNDEILPKHLGFFEDLLKNSTTGWLASTAEPTIADFVLVPRFEWLESGVNDGISTTVFESFPNIKKFIAKFLSEPKILNYYS